MRLYLGTITSLFIHVVQCKWLGYFDGQMLDVFILSQIVIFQLGTDYKQIAYNYLKGVSV